MASGLGLAPRQVEASSHREAPLISGDPEVDNTDVCAFVSPDKQDYGDAGSNRYEFGERSGDPRGEHTSRH